MSDGIFRYSDKFIESFNRLKVKTDELENFITIKSANPLSKCGKNDYKYTGGDLVATGCSHAHIRSDMILVYKLSGKDPCIIDLYVFTTHEESGTGTPPKLKTQKSFATKLKNLTFKG